MFWNKLKVFVSFLVDLAITGYLLFQLGYDLVNRNPLTTDLVAIFIYSIYLTVNKYLASIQQNTFDTVLGFAFIVNFINDLANAQNEVESEDEFEKLIRTYRENENK